MRLSYYLFFSFDVQRYIYFLLRGLDTRSCAQLYCSSGRTVAWRYLRYFLFIACRVLRLLWVDGILRGSHHSKYHTFCLIERTGSSYIAHMSTSYLEAASIVTHENHLLNDSGCQVHCSHLGIICMTTQFAAVSSQRKRVRRRARAHGRMAEATLIWARVLA